MLATVAGWSSGSPILNMAWSTLRKLGTVAAVLITGTIVLLLATMPMRSPGHLLNGTRVVLQSGAYGTSYSPPRPLLDRLLAHLPAAWLTRLHYTLCSGPSGAVRGAPGDIFCFWLDFSSPNAESQKIGYAIADESGFESPMVFNGHYGPYEPGGFARNHSGLIRGAGLFPRRGNSFSLRLYQQDVSGKRVLVAQFPVKNSGLRRTPACQAQPLPISQQTNGLGLTAWLQERRVGPSQEAENATRQIGTNALPTLLKMVIEANSPDQEALLGLARRQSELAFDFYDADEDHNLAPLGFFVLGPTGKGAVTALTNLVTDPNPIVRRTAIACLGSIGPAAQDAVPALIPAITDFLQPQVQATAKFALGAIHAQAAIAVPAMTRMP